MKVEKKITRQSYDYAAERAYCREAQICPNCGNKGNEGDMVIGVVQESVIQYTCAKCGCQWEVEFYCGNRPLPGVLEDDEGDEEA